MASLSITSEDVLVTYKSKIEEAIQLLLSIPPHYKAEAWQFWQIVTQTVRLFTQASLDESTPFIPQSNILSDLQSSTSVISLLSNFPVTALPSPNITHKSSQYKLAQKKKKPSEKKKTKKSMVKKKTGGNVGRRKKNTDKTSRKETSTKTTATNDNEAEIAAQTLTEAYTSAFTPISTLDFSDLVSSNPNSVQSIHLHYEENLEVAVKPVILLPQDEQNIAAGSVRTVSSQADDGEEEDADDAHGISDVVSQEILIEEVETIDEKEEKQKENKRPKRIRYKKNMRVKKIQTDPEFDPVAISIKAEMKESKERKRKEEKEKKQKRKSIKKQGFLYEGHSYSKVPDEVLEAASDLEDYPIEDLQDPPPPKKVCKKKEKRKKKVKPVIASEGQLRVRRKRRTKQELQQASLECTECGLKLSSLGSLDVHMRSHTGERPYQCSLCPKSFTTKGNLQRHETYHQGLRPYECTICGSTFTENKSLKVHLRTHTGERPYVCHICNKAFTQSGPLRVHLKIHDGVKPHLCDICGKEFRHKCNLVHHKDRHHDIRKFKCGERGCTQGFCSKNELQRHLRTHTKMKDYMCNICNKTYSRYQYLKEHMNQHTGEKPFVCQFCPERFKDHGSFHKHKVSAHGSEVEIKSRILQRVPLANLERVIRQGMKEKGIGQGETPTRETTPTEAVNQSETLPTEEQDTEISSNENAQASELTQGPEEQGETVIHVFLSEDWQVGEEQ